MVFVTHATDAAMLRITPGGRSGPGAPGDDGRDGDLGSRLTRAGRTGFERRRIAPRLRPHSVPTPSRPRPHSVPTPSRPRPLSRGTGTIADLRRSAADRSSSATLRPQVLARRFTGRRDETDATAGTDRSAHRSKRRAPGETELNGGRAGGHSRAVRCHGREAELSSRYQSVAVRHRCGVRTGAESDPFQIGEHPRSCRSAPGAPVPDRRRERSVSDRRASAIMPFRSWRPSSGPAPGAIRFRSASIRDHAVPLLAPQCRTGAGSDPLPFA